MIDNRTPAGIPPVVTPLQAAGLNPLANPAAASAPAARSDADRKRIPMSVPVRKLEVPKLEGYHLHWFVESNVHRAKQGGYEMVSDREVTLNNRGVGSSSDLSGNSSLGTNVEVLSGIGSDGKPHSLFLMKIKEEWYQQDQQELTRRNQSVVEAIFSREAIAGSENVSGSDRTNRYVKTASAGILNRGLKKKA